VRARGPFVAAGLALAALSLAARAADACAGCRNPNLPLTRLSNVFLSRGELRLSAALSGTFLEIVHPDGCLDLAACGEIPAQPRYLHDQTIVPGELRAVAELGLSSSWGVEAQVPYRVTRTTIRYTTLQGDPYVPLDPDVHHRDETLHGLGDPWLLARLGRALGAGFVLTARAGTTLPLGRTVEDPFRLGDLGLRHEHIQFGNGTFDPLLALDLARAFGPIQAGAYAQAQLTLYENAKGFRAGNRYFGGASGGTRVLEKVVAALGLDVLHERPERWRGVARQDGNLGRTELLAGLTLTRPFGQALAALVVRVPVYRHIVAGTTDPGTLTSPASLSLVVSRTFAGG
jgi:hypothetical protein